MLRVLKGSDTVITSPTFVANGTETPTNCDTNPTCTVAQFDGTALTAAVVSQTSSTDSGVYQAAITTTHTATLDRLTITWTGLVSSKTQVYTDTVEVVGGHYVSLPEIRNYRALADVEKFTTAELLALRDQFESMVERICNRAFVRRFAADRFPGDGSSYRSLDRRPPRSVISVKVNGTAQTASNFSVAHTGDLYWWSGTFPAPSGATGGLDNCRVTYEHGWDAPPPELKRECLKWIRSEALAERSGVPTNAISTSYDGQVIRFSTPDGEKGRYTGVMSLDAVLENLIYGSHVA